MATKKESENLVNQSMVLDQFLSTLVKSVAKGQTALQHYYTEDEEGRNSTVAYTIPSVSLEIKLNFTTSEEKGISFFFKKTKETATEVFSSMKLNLSAIPNPRHPTSRKTYTVEDEGNLRNVANKLNVSMKDLLELNRGKIPNPNKLPPGLVLTIRP